MLLRQHDNVYPVLPIIDWLSSLLLSTGSQFRGSILSSLMGLFTAPGKRAGDILKYPDL